MKHFTAQNIDLNLTHILFNNLTHILFNNTTIKAFTHAVNTNIFYILYKTKEHPMSIKYDYITTKSRF